MSGVEVRVLTIEEAAEATGSTVVAVRARVRRENVWHLFDHSKVVLLDGVLATPDEADEVVNAMATDLAAADAARKALEDEVRWLRQEREIADRRLADASLRMADIMELTGKQLRDQTMQSLDRADPRR